MNYTVKPVQRPSWSWSYGTWIYNYLCNQYLSPQRLWVWTPLRRGVLDTTLCDKVCQWLAAGGVFFPGTPVSSTNKIDRHDITEILLKAALNTITIYTTINSVKEIMQELLFVGYYYVFYSLWIWFVFCCLTPLSAIFQLHVYHGDQF